MFRFPALLAALVVALASSASRGAPGDVDTAFDPQVNAHPFGIGIQPDGKINVVGWFARIGGEPRAGIGRILSDGRLDRRFDPASSDQVFCTAIQPDGKILVAGSFREIDNQFHGRIARLDADGSLDNRFQANAGQSIYSMSVLEDGKILITGSFNTVNGVDRWKVARLKADGTLDTSFANPQVNAQVWTHWVQPDGKILIGGSFETVAGRTQTRLARLNPDGSHDRSFPNPNMEGKVHGIVVQPDGKIVIGGTFPKVGGSTRNGMARFSPNGGLDSRFSPSLDDDLYTMMPQADGKLVITGSFTRVDGAVRVYTARLEADGTLDNTFVGNGRNANRTVLSCALQADGKVLIGGNYSEINGVRRPSFARLQNDPATQTLSVPSGDRVEWLRGGSSPYLQRAWFELSTNGGSSWTPLAGGTRIAGGWEATGLSLAGDGLVRARGYAPGGRFNGSSSLMETQVAFSFPPPDATTLAATGITSVSATVNGEVNANGTATAVIFEYGLTSTYTDSLAALPAMLGGNLLTPVSATLSGLLPETTYHYRVSATNPSGTTNGADMMFTTLSDNAKLAGLRLSNGALVPGFEKLTTHYIATVAHATGAVTLTPTTDHPRATVVVDGVTVASGSASGLINLGVGNTTIDTVVTAEDGISTKTYTLTATRLPQEFFFNSATDVPVRAEGFSTGGYPANVVLNYAPLPGTILTMVENTGLEFIRGFFSNLVQGQRVSLGYGGGDYEFVVNYFGGTGNDLVLQWADTQVIAWGSNQYGQLGDASTTGRLEPTAVDDSGVLAGKTVVAVADGYLHSLALCADGTLAAWGYNAYGQLGDGGSNASTVPVAVDQTGALAGKTVVAISPGPFHNLALCADGTVVSWGFNNYGQLGTGDRVTSRVPVRVEPVGALAGKEVVAVAAATYCSLALCGDGTVVGWGYNDEGELGDGTTVTSLSPVAVRSNGALAGKQVAALAAGQYHSLALCTNGSLVAWGYNEHGQLGDGGAASMNEPVAIDGGALTGKTVVAVSAGKSHSLALCSDGTLASWGWNQHGQLGVDSIAQSSVPVVVNTSGGMLGGDPLQIAVGGTHSLVLLSHGSLVAWGDNADGQLGDNGTASRPVPALVDMSTLPSGTRVMFAAGGCGARHNLAVVAQPVASPSPLPANAESADAYSATGDADHDGLSDLIEYAFGLDPLNDSSGDLPQGRIVGDDFVLSFTQPQNVTDIDYGAEWSEWSETMRPGSWTALPDTGSGLEHHFRVPTHIAPSVFVRLTVRQK